jgi:predicted small metal-binding protein
MFSLNCKDMGQADCEFVATGETKEEVMQKAAAHAMEKHGMSEADMAGKKDAAMAAITEVAA